MEVRGSGMTRIAPEMTSFWRMRWIASVTGNQGSGVANTEKTSGEEESSRKGEA